MTGTTPTTGADHDAGTAGNGWARLAPVPELTRPQTVDARGDRGGGRARGSASPARIRNGRRPTRDANGAPDSAPGPGPVGLHSAEQRTPNRGTIPASTSSRPAGPGVAPQAPDAPSRRSSALRPHPGRSGCRRRGAPAGSFVAPQHPSDLRRGEPHGTDPRPRPPANLRIADARAAEPVPGHRPRLDPPAIAAGRGGPRRSVGGDGRRRLERPIEGATIRDVRQAEDHRGALRRADEDARRRRRGGRPRRVRRPREGAGRNPADRREKFRDYKAVESAIGDARGIAGTDAELRELAEREVADLEGRREDLLAAIRCPTAPKDPDDGRNAVLEIRAGTGGDEVGLFVAAPRPRFRPWSRNGARSRWRVRRPRTARARRAF